MQLSPAKNEPERGQKQRSIRGRGVRNGWKDWTTQKCSPTPAAASSRMLLATVAMNDMELQHIDVEQAFIQVEFDEEIFTEPPEACQKCPEAVGKLKRALDGLVQPSRNWDLMLTESQEDIGFEQWLADPRLL